jgi:hypothetical protein
VDDNNEGRASVLRKRRKEVLEGVNAARRGADGDDHRVGVFSRRNGLCLVLAMARHDTTPRVKLPIETYRKCCSFASFDLTALEPRRRTHVAAAGGLGWFAKPHGEDDLAKRCCCRRHIRGGVDARLASSSRSTYRACPLGGRRTARPGGAPTGELCRRRRGAAEGPQRRCPADSASAPRRRSRLPAQARARTTPGRVSIRCRVPRQ